jgi:hypothetical protein
MERVSSEFLRLSRPAAEPNNEHVIASHAYGSRGHRERQAGSGNKLNSKENWWQCLGGRS